MNYTKLNDNSYESECTLCGICIDKCPYEIYGETYSLKGRLLLIKEYLNGRIKADFLLNFLVNCTVCQRCSICPYSIDISSVLDKIISSDNSLRKSVINLLNSLVQSVTVERSSDCILLCNKVYVYSAKEISLLYDSLHNILPDKYLGLATFSYPYHVPDVFTKLINSSILNEALSLLKGYKKIYCIDDYTYVYLRNLGLTNMYSILDLFIEILDKGLFTIDREVDLTVYVSLPIISEISSAVQEKYREILNLIPRLVVRGYGEIMDLPLICSDDDLRDFLHKNGFRYYRTFLKNLVKENYHCVITNSSILYNNLLCCANSIPIAISYLPMLVVKLFK